MGKLHKITECRFQSPKVRVVTINICIINDMRHADITQILKHLKADLEAILGDRMEALYLYGSQARDEARSDSDIDVLVVLRGDFQYFDMVQQTGDLAARLSLRYDTVISLAFISEEKYNHQQIPFILNVRQEGIAI